MQLFDLTLSGIWLKFPLARCCMEGIDITLGFWLFLQRQPNLEKNNLWFLCSTCNWYKTFIVICWRSIKIGLWLLLQSHMSLEKRLRLEGHRPLMFLRKNNVWCLCSICYWYIKPWSRFIDDLIELDKIAAGKLHFLLFCQDTEQSWSTD